MQLKDEIDETPESGIGKGSGSGSGSGKGKGAKNKSCISCKKCFLCTNHVIESSEGENQFTINCSLISMDFGSILLPKENPKEKRSKRTAASRVSTAAQQHIAALFFGLEAF